MIRKPRLELPCKMVSWKHLLALLLLLLIFTVFDFFNIQSVIFSQPKHRPNNRENWGPLNHYKTILLWNGLERIETMAFGTGYDVFVRQQCPISKCMISTDPSELPIDDYDAIVINVNELRKSKYNRIPSLRKAHQRYVLFTQESPINMPYFKADQYSNYFNWTMSYKLNSDIPLLYGRVIPRASAPINLQAEAKSSHRQNGANKTKMVAWMVSHCHTFGKREVYAHELAKHIQLDVYGKCGTLSCPRNESNWLSEPSCYTMLEQNYKFYLSFENALCTDYVTEKFFNVLNRNIIPIVYGKADYGRLVPPHSFIDAQQFTPQELAAYLKKLDANQSLYNEFFWWKEHYAVEAGVEQMVRHGFCDLCQKLHTDQSAKVYQDLEPEWSSHTQCILVDQESSNWFYFVLVISICSGGTFIVVTAFYCFQKYKQRCGVCTYFSRTPSNCSGTT